MLGKTDSFLRPPAVACAALQLLPLVARAALAAADRSLTPCQLPHVVLTRQSGCVSDGKPA